MAIQVVSTPIALDELRRTRQADLGGINLYPDRPIDEFIEFDSMINVRPSHGNRSRGVEDPLVQDRIKDIVGSLIVR